MIPLLASARKECIKKEYVLQFLPSLKILDKYKTTCLKVIRYQGKMEQIAVKGLNEIKAVKAAAGEHLHPFHEVFSGSSSVPNYQPALT